MGQVGRDVANVALMWKQLQGFSHKDWGSQIRRSVDDAYLSLTALDTPPAKTLRIAWRVDLGFGYSIDNGVRQALLAVVQKPRIPPNL
jgi:hypothetical protein